MGPKKNNRNKKNNNNKGSGQVPKEESTTPVLTTVSVESSDINKEISNDNIIIEQQPDVIQEQSSSELISTTPDVILEESDDKKTDQEIITKKELQSSLSASIDNELNRQKGSVSSQTQPSESSENCNNSNKTTKTTTTTTTTTLKLASNNANKLVKNITDAFTRASELEEEPSSPKTNQEWKQLYFLISKQLGLERVKCETLEGLIIQKDKENQSLIEQVNRLETELFSERRRINRTIGTTKLQTRKLLSTVKFDHNIDIASIIEDLNNIDSSISASPSFADELTSASISNSASNSFTEFNGDQLLHKLNNTYHSSSSLINAPISTDGNGNTLTTSSERPQSNLVTSNSSNGSIGGGNGSIRLSVSNTSINSLTSSASRANLTSLACASYSSKEDVEKITLVQSLVRKWLARKRYKKLRTKRAIVEELYETESTYVTHLSNLIKVFVHPLKAKKGDSILPTDEFDSIFSNITSIYKSNSFFLDQVDEIFKKFNRWSCFGDKLLKLVPLFDCYVDYIINYEYALKNLKRAISSFSSFANFVKQGNSRKELDDLDLEDLLIMPVQRVPRYIMLLKEIRKYTPLYHNDFNSIDKALEAFKHFAASVNKKSGARKMVLQLEDRLLNYKDDITSHSRILIREGPIKFKKNQEYAFLFNDMVVVVHPTHSKKVKKSLLATSDKNSADKVADGANGSNRSPTPTSPVLRDSNPTFNSMMAETSFTSMMNGANSAPSAPVYEFHSSNLDINFKFLARYTLDAKVKIIQDLTDPKFTVLVPDAYSIDLIAPSMEERKIWVEEINKIVAIFTKNNLTTPPQIQDN
ncbi:hypothetical protein DICPUDRAFT_99010 [Dictyostelium purpureum]|uniref:DH domain-containing protein n=1 Tax=Dictyostelium purpureum TaxID=5786 RepID=F0ZVI3_DICPU|nr:uncharacterized protein DICPUDRAFT_99010 [Dictyostelium purpureum]EGC32040.1 hypothetical protein DICPUDRAFT_99010 [Dictyostelium purpureum]|eukprot:XP_003291426.1 hypothetical protein DICPUDRAFT_99010 [Dictyostelium purpureum]